MQLGARACHGLGPGDQLGTDGGRVLAAGVVVGHDQHVGEPGGDLAHHRALAGVAVAAGTEHHDQTAFRQRAQGVQRSGDGVGLVGVVHDGEEVLAGFDLLEPTGHSPGLAHRGGHRARVEPGLAERGDRAERVGHVEVPGEGHPRPERLARRGAHGERGAGGLEVHVVGTPVGVGAGGREGPHRDGRLLHEPPAEVVVDVDQAEPCTLGGEEGGLGGEVVLDVGVEVEVVAAEVGEAGHVEHHPVDAAHDEGVAGDLHGARRDLVLDHDREQGVQVGGLRGGQGGLEIHPGDAGADGADHGCADPRGAQRRLGEAGRGGLALGAGDRDHPHPPGGLPVDPGGQVPDDLARPLDHQHRDAGGVAEQRSLAVREHGDGAVHHGLVGVRRAVSACSGRVDVQVTGTDPQRADGDAGDGERADHRTGVAHLEERVAEPVRDLLQGRLRGRRGTPGSGFRHDREATGRVHHRCGAWVPWRRISSILTDREHEGHGGRTRRITEVVKVIRLF